MAPQRLGPYRIERLLGRGGMGTVYLGREIETGDEVAVKVLSAALADDERFRERFKTEIESLKKLIHPHIVRLFGFGQEEGHLYYSMEIVAGGSLQDELKAGRRFAWRDVTRIATQICAALRHAHNHGVVHRDLKPANLLYTTDEQVKLTDFGIAKMFGGSQITADGGMIGTADYMAPEQADGRPATARSDMYALGGVMHALLTGLPPFHAKALPEVLRRLRYEAPTPVRQLNRDVPEELERIILELLEKDPEKRSGNPRLIAKRLMAMEHALSVDTRVDEGDEPPDSSQSTFHSGAAPKTVQRPAVTIDSNVHEARTRSPSSLDAFSPTTDSAPKATDRAAESGAARFTTVDVARARESEESDLLHGTQMSWWGRLAILAAILLILAGAAAWIRRLALPPDPDRLFAGIQAAQESGVDALLETEDDIDAFLARKETDPRADQVRLWQADIQAERLFRRLELLSRRRGGADALPAIQQAFLDAMRARQANLASARQKFQFLVDVFADQEDASDVESVHCVQLARHQLARLAAPPPGTTPDRVAELTKLLESAETHAAPEELLRVRRGIIGLYADKPWAADVVRRCREALEPGPPSP